MITHDQESFARYCGAWLLLLIAAYPKEFHRGGLLLVVELWFRETLYHLFRYATAVQSESDDWTKTRVDATRRATLRCIRRQTGRLARMRRYERKWPAAKPKPHLVEPAEPVAASGARGRRERWRG